MYLLLSLLFSATSFAAGSGGGAIGAPGDPATITAKATYLTATAQKQQAETSQLIAVADARLAEAQAAHEWALVRYLEDQRRILNQEYLEIQKAQTKFRFDIAALEWKLGTMTRLRLGMADEAAFDGLNSLIAGAEDAEPIHAAFEKPVPKIPASAFIPRPRDARAETPPDFEGGDVWDLLVFVREHHLWMVEMKRAHVIVSRTLSTVTRVAVNQILGKEQAIQAARAARLTEVFLHPPRA